MEQLFIVTILDLNTTQKTICACYKTYEQAKKRQEIWNKLFTQDRLQKLACIETAPLINHPDY